MLSASRRSGSEAAEAIGAASTTAELEELRVRYLGRKAELTQILRGISDLPAEERGPVGKAGNEARRALETLLEPGAELERASSRTGSPRTRSTSRCPALRRSRSGHRTRCSAPGARSRTSSSASAIG